MSKSKLTKSESKTMITEAEADVDWLETIHLEWGSAPTELWPVFVQPHFTCQDKSVYNN